LHLNVIHAAAAARVKVSLRRLSPHTPQSALFVLFMSAARRRRESRDRLTTISSRLTYIKDKQPAAAAHDPAAGPEFGEASLLIISKHGSWSESRRRRYADLAPAPARQRAARCENNAVAPGSILFSTSRASSEWTLCAYVYSRLSALLPNELPLIGF